MCWCSSSSWRSFAKVHGWEYKLWRDPELAELVPKMVTPALWMKPFPSVTEMNEQRGLMQSAIARYEVIRLYGGLYVDCDLFWLGANVNHQGHAPTMEFLSHIAARPAPVVVVPHFMPDAHNYAKNPIPIFQPRGTHGHQMGGMFMYYLNNAVLGAPPRSPVLENLLEDLPALVNNTVGRAEKHQTRIDEWRVTGPGTARPAHYTCPGKKLAAS